MRYRCFQRDKKAFSQQGLHFSPPLAPISVLVEYYPVTPFWLQIPMFRDMDRRANTRAIMLTSRSLCPEYATPLPIFLCIETTACQWIYLSLGNLLWNMACCAEMENSLSLNPKNKSQCLLSRNGSMSLADYSTRYWHPLTILFPPQYHYWLPLEIHFIDYGGDQSPLYYSPLLLTFSLIIPCLMHTGTP